jgi:hypothetical protein
MTRVEEFALLIKIVTFCVHDLPIRKQREVLDHFISTNHDGNGDKFSDTEGDEVENLINFINASNYSHLIPVISLRFPFNFNFDAICCFDNKQTAA